MGKWSQNYLIAFIDMSDQHHEAQDVVTESAVAYATKYRIPREKRLTNDEAVSAVGLFTHLPPRSNALAGCTLEDKLMIVAHGNTKKVDASDASTLAVQLADWGLREIGLITFKACAVGKGFYLEQLLLYLGKKKVRVDWLKGYTGSAITEFEPNQPTPEQSQRLQKLQQRAQAAVEAIEGLGDRPDPERMRKAKAQSPAAVAKLERSVQKLSDAAVSLGAKHAHERIIDDDEELTGSDRYRIIRGNADAGERGRYVFKTLAQGLRARDDFYS